MTDADAAAPRRAGSSRLGVTGSIAAYKAVELLRLLRAEGADVAVMLSPAATRFVGPLTFAALSRHPVETDVLELLPDGRIGHIVVADSADAIVVAPATAHWLGAMANGLAGDVVTATVLAIVRAGRRRAGDGRRHVDAPGDAGQRRAAARRLRLRDRRAGGRRAGVGPVGRRAAGGAAGTSSRPWSRPSAARPVRAADAEPPPAAASTGPRDAGPRPVATSSSAPAARARPSIRSASSATARPAGWASRSPRPRWTAGRG